MTHTTAGGSLSVSFNGQPVDNAELAVRRLLEALGVPADAHTIRTPARVARAWRHALRGYGLDPSRHLAVTFPGPEHPALICQTGVRFVTTCAHHLLPVIGLATVSYRPAPDAPIVGLSKLARVVEDAAARVTVQETLGAQVADAVADRLDVEGAACVLTAAHGCMTLRGVMQPDARTTTVSLSGGWTEDLLDVRDTLSEHRAAVAGWKI